MLSANQHGKTFNNNIIFHENLSLLNVDIQIHVYIKDRNSSSYVQL